MFTGRFGLIRLNLGLIVTPNVARQTVLLGEPGPRLIERTEVVSGDVRLLAGPEVLGHEFAERDRIELVPERTRLGVDLVIVE